jgi:hypothetical protein
MRKAEFGEVALSLVTTDEHAISMVGDLLEETEASEAWQFLVCSGADRGLYGMATVGSGPTGRSGSRDSWNIRGIRPPSVGGSHHGHSHCSRRRSCMGHFPR